MNIHKQYPINIQISPQPCKQSIATSSGSKEPKDQNGNLKPQKPGQSPTIDLPLPSVATDHAWLIERKLNKKTFGSVVSVALTKRKPQQVLKCSVLPVFIVLEAREDLQDKSWNPGNETSSEALGHTHEAQKHSQLTLCHAAIWEDDITLVTSEICFSSTCSCWDVSHSASP